MADKSEVKKDLDFCSCELEKYQNLSRSGLSRDELITIDSIIVRLKERIKNLRILKDEETQRGQHSSITRTSHKSC
ncbi:hypothetical protein [Acinetobacter baumannii]|uniref:hypothetical protein n=1 Tax=Acinetobacter baumannii TaxID=470 RepID=UPI00112D13B5|nr:hypothetical protein [Acinetobacter baumannii]TPT55489.1 hypothetical protein FJU64_08135 [Acinetobacter baumannii]